MTTTITIIVNVGTPNQRTGTAQMQVTIPDKMLDYINPEQLSIDLPSLLKVALANYRISLVMKEEMK